MQWRLPVVICLSALPAVACMADIAVEESALLYDLLAPLETQSPPPGTDPAIFGGALDALRQEKLAGQSGRPVFREPGLLDNYGKALMLGARAPTFAKEIGQIRDLAASGQQPALEAALADVWVKAGRTRPDSKALAPVIAAIRGEKGNEPQETIHHVFDKPGHRIDVMHARAGGRMQVDVVRKNAAGEEQDRTAIAGNVSTTPTADGRELERHLLLDKACTSTPATDAQTRAQLAGEWTSQSGLPWRIAVDGEKVTLTETRVAPLGALEYTGTYRLGRIQAQHPITRITDMGEDLPAAVRGQLVTMGLSFRVALEACADDAGRLRGTWSSQHVTYSGMTMTVSKVHDPYDLNLVLHKGGVAPVMRTAPGAAAHETL